MEAQLPVCRVAVVAKLELAKRSQICMPKNVPPVDVRQNFICSRFGVGMVNVPLNPHYQMIFERSLDKLMKDIRGYELMDVGASEITREGLQAM